MIIFQLPKPHKILTVQVVWVAVEVHNWAEGHSLTILLTGLIHPPGLAIKKLLSADSVVPTLSSSTRIFEDVVATDVFSTVDPDVGTPGSEGFLLIGVS